MPRYTGFASTTTPAARFLEEFARALERAGRRALWIRPKRTVAWREGDTLNHALLVRWNGEDPDAPRITRISVNYYAFGASARTRLLLGFDLPDHPGHREGLRLELTVLDRELVAFAEWLVRWIVGRVNPEIPIPPPPVECHNWHRDWLTTDYAWSAAAWEAQRAWRAQEEEARARREANRRALRAKLADATAASPGTEAEQ